MPIAERGLPKPGLSLYGVNAVLVSAAYTEPSAARGLRLHGRESHEKCGEPKQNGSGAAPTERDKG